MCNTWPILYKKGRHSPGDPAEKLGNWAMWSKRGCSESWFDPDSRKEMAAAKMENSAPCWRWGLPAKRDLWDKEAFHHETPEKLCGGSGGCVLGCSLHSLLFHPSSIFKGSSLERVWQGSRRPWHLHDTTIETNSPFRKRWSITNKSILMGLIKEPGDCRCSVCYFTNSTSKWQRARLTLTLSGLKPCLSIFPFNGFLQIKFVEERLPVLL